MPKKIFQGNKFDAKVIRIRHEAKGAVFITLIPERSEIPLLTPTEEFYINQSNHSGILGLLLAAYLNNLSITAHVNPKATKTPEGYREVYAVELRQDAAKLHVPDDGIGPVVLVETGPVDVVTPSGTPKPPEPPPIGELPVDKKPGTGQQYRSMAENEMLTLRSEQIQRENVKLEIERLRLQIELERLRLVAGQLGRSLSNLSEED
jgi:hypothetical protein